MDIRHEKEMKRRIRIVRGQQRMWASGYTCRVKGCTEPRIGLGGTKGSWCKDHTEQYLLYGDPCRIRL